MRFLLNSAEVASERLEGEVIAIHLVSGSYYNFRGSGEFLWTCVTAGWTPDEIAEHLSASCGQKKDDIIPAVADFIAYLSHECLIAPRPEDVREEMAALPQLQHFLPPETQKFTDMQELLLVDPIHEVTEAGWPERGPSTA